MGKLSTFDLNLYPRDIFIETGTGGGAGLAHAAKFPFINLYSIEILRNVYDRNVQKFKKDERIMLIHNNSEEGLRQIFTQDTRPAVFWLDAHLPHLYDKKNYDWNTPQDIIYPLEAELKIIVSSKNYSRDVFVLDDLRMYVPYDSYKPKIDKPGIEFIYSILGDTHNIEIVRKDQGYILCVPKEDGGK